MTQTLMNHTRGDESPGGVRDDTWSRLLMQVGQERNQQAFAKLFGHFAPLIKGFCLANPSSSLPGEAADELVQEVMFKVWTKAPSYDASKAAASTWIFTVMRNCRIDMMRRNSRHQVNSADVDVDDIWDEELDHQPFVRLQQARNEDMIQKSFATLPIEQKQALTQVYMQGKSHSEIAEETVRDLAGRFAPDRRRIGLVAGEEIPLVAGAKLNGRIANTLTISMIPTSGFIAVGTPPVDDLHRPTEGRGDLEEVGHAAHVGRPVAAGRMEQRRVEEDGVALCERQLDVLGLEELDELRKLPRDVAGEVLLRVRQVHRRAGLDRHVAVRDCTLQGEQRRELVDVCRVLRRSLRAEETEVVVAVRALRLAAGVDHVDLRGDLVAGAQPGRGHEGQAHHGDDAAFLQDAAQRVDVVHAADTIIEPCTSRNGSTS